MAEGAARSIQLHLGAVVVAQGAACLGDEHAGTCSFVGDVELAPDPPRTPKLWQRTRRVAAGEQDLASRSSGQPLYERWIERRREGVELRRGIARRGRVADGQHDLDERPEQARPRQRLLALRDRPQDGDRGRISPSLRESQQRQPGLGTRLRPRISGL